MSEGLFAPSHEGSFVFIEAGNRGWQAVLGGTPKSGNLPPGYCGDAGATNQNWKNLRLCSDKFAYVRLTREKVRAGRATIGIQKNEKFQENANSLCTFFSASLR
ncbi:MAG TPA: hypothetical protein VK742_16710 [Candidatus Sulfotelmatobacter sp.]|jgi:hypothetical protein|nr:hypothetical protein [Candidatus Sulfotelmatobacter sp.]